jgi:CubicO group peptidase (beta-lactamase class C family)
MVLNGGVADERRIVPAEWIRASTQPTGPENSQRGGYGLQWWTFANTDAFAAIGLQGQYIYIDPATQTVVVKLSYFPPGDNSAQDGETMEFMAAVSAWKPR